MLILVVIEPHLYPRPQHNELSFQRALFSEESILTASLDDENKAAANRMREMGSRTLEREGAANVCGRQTDHAYQLRTALSSAQTWAEVRTRARLPAMLSDSEEVRNGLLVDDDTGEPINSEIRMSPGFGATMPANGQGGRLPFVAVLTVSPNGYVTACEVESSSGNERLDSRICRQAKMPRIHRPAFVEGRPAVSTTKLRINFDG